MMSEFDGVLPLLPTPLDSMAQFAFLTGWRRSKLLGLRWEWVDRAGREIRIPDSKNGAPRSLPVDDELWAILEALWSARRYETPMGPALSAFVFHRKGRPVNRHTFADQWQDAKGLVRKGGLEPPRCYPQVPETCASTSSATFAGTGRVAASL